MNKEESLIDVAISDLETKIDVLNAVKENSNINIKEQASLFIVVLNDTIKSNKRLIKRIAKYFKKL